MRGFQEEVEEEEVEEGAEVEVVDIMAYITLRLTLLHLFGDICQDDGRTQLKPVQEVGGRWQKLMLRFDNLTSRAFFCKFNLITL